MEITRTLVKEWPAEGWWAVYPPDGTVAAYETREQADAVAATCDEITVRLAGQRP